MKKLIRILKAGFPIIGTYLLSYGIILLSAIIYYLLRNDNVDYFLSNICPYILMIYYIVVILYLYHQNKIKEPKLHKYFPNSYLGITLAIFLNMIIFKLTSTSNINSLPLPVAILSSGIVGPIYEEILFRYIFYNRLKKMTTIKQSIFLTSILFALMHASPIKILYALILGFTLNIMYEKEKNILSPILIHISANTIVLFLHEYNADIFFLSLINLFLSIQIVSRIFRENI